MIQSVSWLINDMGPYEVTALLNGTLTGYSSNGNNLIVQNVTMNDVRNGSNYSCVINITIAILLQSYPTTLYVAGEYVTHSYITIGGVGYIFVINAHPLGLCSNKDILRV